MKLPQFVLFVALAFFAMSAYLILLALWNGSVGGFIHFRFLDWLLNRVMPICAGLIVAGYLGAWRPGTHLAYKALAVFASGLMIVPAQLAVTYLGVLICGAVPGGCFN